MEFELIRHLKTSKMFVLLDDSRLDRWKVINPAGVKLVMPVEHFDEEPELVAAEDASDMLTEIQFEAAKKEYENDESQAQQALAAMTRQKEQAVRASRAASDPTPKRPRKKREKVDNRTGLGATWSSALLTFYKHHIDPLGPKQSFRIQVEKVGELQMTKTEFQSVFNDVVMNTKYRQEGFFSYDELPDKAKKFIKEDS